MVTASPLATLDSTSEDAGTWGSSGSLGRASSHPVINVSVAPSVDTSVDEALDVAGVLTGPTGASISTSPMASANKPAKRRRFSAMPGFFIKIS